MMDLLGGFTRRSFIKLGVAACPNFGGCNPVTEQKPILRVAIGKTSGEIDAQSTLKIARDGYSGRGGEPRFYTSPHVFIYSDERLQLTLTECGQKVSMPTVVTMMDDRLESISTTSVLGEYASIGLAISEAEKIQHTIENQGFKFKADEYSRLAEVGAYAAKGVSVPRTVAAIGDVLPYFLNVDYCIKEIIFFILIKDGLQVQLRMRNMRRSFPRDGNLPDDVRRGDAALGKMGLEKEPVYYLDLSIENA